jgi:hypothetical protein
MRPTGFPCALLLWASAFALPLTQESLFLRALRVVVMTDGECRTEDAALISQQGTLKHLARVALISLCMAAYYHSMATGAQLSSTFCYVYQPWPVFLGLQLITTVNALTISSALLAAQDGLRMAAEVWRSFAII